MRVMRARVAGLPKNSRTYGVHVSGGRVEVRRIGLGVRRCIPYVPKPEVSFQYISLNLSILFLKTSKIVS